MIWKETYKIENVYMPKINNDRLFFYKKDKNIFKFMTRHNGNINIYENLNMDMDYNYEVFGHKIFFSSNGVLKNYDLIKNHLESVYKNEQDYITIVNQYYFIVSKYSEQKKTYKNLLINKEYKELQNFSDFESFREFSDNYIICTKTNNIIGLFDLNQQSFLWSKNLDENSLKTTLFLNTQLILVFNDCLVSYDILTGDYLWELRNTFSTYIINKDNTKLFGLEANKFEIINIKSGEKELVTQLDENLNISSHLVTYHQGYLYFSAFLNNIPVFGAVNVENGELDFIQEIEGEKSFRKGFSKPLKAGNTLYIRDSSKTLHVFRKNKA